MSAKITVGGRVVTSTDPRRDPPSIIRGRPRPAVSQDSVEPPYEEKFLTKAIGQIDLSHDGVRYRVFKYLDPRAGWCTAAMLMEEFGVPFSVLADWAVVGHIEPGAEQGSPSRRFRVKDVAVLRKVASKWLAEKAYADAKEASHAPAPLRPVKEKWWT